MGWQFAAAEFVGGPIMIVLLAVTGAFVLSRRLTDRARDGSSPADAAAVTTTTPWSG